MTKELEIGKKYVIDWKMVKNLSDVIKILKQLRITFTVEDESDLFLVEPVKEFLTEVPTND